MILETNRRCNQTRDVTSAYIDYSYINLNKSGRVSAIEASFMAFYLH